MQNNKRRPIRVENMNLNPNKGVTPEIGAEAFESEVLKSKLPVLVAFWAPWSRPCQILSAVLDEIAGTCTTQAKVVKVNADDHPDLSLWYEVQSIPTVLFMLDGTVRAKVVGTASREALLARLESVVSENRPCKPPQQL